MIVSVVLNMLITERFDTVRTRPLDFASTISLHVARADLPVLIVRCATQEALVVTRIHLTQQN